MISQRTVARISGLFSHALSPRPGIPNPVERLSTMYWAAAKLQKSTDFTEFVGFARKLYVDGRVADDDQFPLVGKSIEQAGIRSVLHIHKGNYLNPCALNQKMREASTERERRGWQLLAGEETLVEVVAWHEIPRDCLEFFEPFQLPIIKSVGGRVFVGVWDFDVNISNAGESLVLGAAVFLSRFLPR